MGEQNIVFILEEKVENVQAVGGTKNIKLEAIHKLKPSLIIVEKEENTKEIVEELQKHYPVYVAEVQSVDDAYRMIRDVGHLTDRDRDALILQEEILTQFQLFPRVNGKSAAYVIWKKPYMVVGKDTYIQSILEELGFINPFVEFEGRYPVVTAEDFHNAKLDYILLASEPYPYKEKHKAEFLTMMPDVKPLIVDGEMFWYGPKMIEAVRYFKGLKF